MNIEGCTQGRETELHQAMRREDDACRRGLTSFAAVVFVAALAFAGCEARRGDAARGTPQDAVSDVVRARQFVLVDANGNARARLEVGTNGAVGFKLSDQIGTNRVELIVRENGASTLRMLDQNGRSQVFMHAENDAFVYLSLGRGRVTIYTSEPATRLSLSDKKGTNRVHLSAFEFGSQLALCDENGTSRVFLSAFNDEAELALSDKKGTNRVRLIANEFASQLALSDKKGTNRVFLSALKDVTMLDLSDENGKSRAALTAFMKPGPELLLFDQNGTSRAVLGAVETETPDGKSISYPESTLTLFGPDGKVLSQLP